MLKFLDPEKFYTRRNYLRQWFDSGTLITDNDFENVDRTLSLLKEVPTYQRIIDITHNPSIEDSRVCIDSAVVLSNNFIWWYRPDIRFKFFPLFLWAYSLRKNLWWEDFVFDAGSNKTQGFMCLNNQIREHRTKLYLLMRQNGALPKIAYTIDKQGLPDEPNDPYRNDVGVGHPVYTQTAVNIVTETSIDLTYISEKTCKPFIAHQIPIIVAAAGANKFLHDTGLDMFEDLVPWRTWDSEQHSDVRLQKISQFVKTWIDSGTVLHDYQQVLPRIKANKLYFHSEKFRDFIMQHML